MVKFRIKGCDISLGTGFFAVITLMLITCRTTTVFQSLICSFFHEIGHIAAMMIFGENMKSISFSATGIKIDKFSVTNLDYFQEIIVSLAGIFVNFIISLIAFGCYFAFDLRFAFDTAVISLMIGGFNLLPIASLDGARALRFFIILHFGERTADKVIAATSGVSIVVLTVLSVSTIIYGSANYSLIFATVYLSSLCSFYIYKLKG